MDHGTRFFWALIAVLLGASTYFGIAAERERRVLARGNGDSLEDGALVTMLRVIDGDTVVVKAENGSSTAVRIVGIKAFDTNVPLDPAVRFGRLAMDSLEKALKERPTQILLGSPPKDRHGRVLATLIAEEQDVALSLIQQGLVLVYTAYPFPAMPLYLHEQEAARAARLGLWSDAKVVKRADLLSTSFQREGRRAE